MSTTSITSRIARHLTLRRAEIAGHVGSFVAASLTVLVVGTAWGMEGNPVSRWIISEIGINWWAVLTPIGVAVGFALCRVASRLDSEQIASRVGWLFATALAADGVLNTIHFVQNPIPGFMLAHGWVYYARMAVIGLITVICLTRPYEPFLRNSVVARLFARFRALARAAAPVAVALLMVTSVFAGVVVLGTQSTSQSQSGVAEAMSPSGDTVYSASADGTVKAIDADTGEENWTYTGHSDGVNDVIVSPDGSLVFSASTDGTVKAIDSETGEEEWSFGGHSDGVHTVSVSPDGETVYSGSIDDTVKAIDADTGEENWTFSGHSGAIEGIKASPDGETVFSGSGDNTVKAIDAETGEEEWTFDGHSATVYDISVSPDGETVYSGSFDETLKAIDADTGEENWTYTGHSGGVHGVTISPDGETVYSGSFDNTVKAIDSETGDEIWSFDGHSDRVYGISASPDGETVYSSSLDDTVKAIDAETGEEDWSFDGHTDYVDDVSAGYLYGGGSSGADINGTVENQNGQPVANATVVGWGVDYSNISAGQAQSLDDRARELVQESSNVRPAAFDSELQLAGSGGTFQSASDPYVAVHTRGDWNVRTAGDEPAQDVNPDLGQPAIRLPANEELVFSAWNPENDPLIEDSTDGDLPGATVPEGQTIVIEQIGPSNSTIKEPLRLETEPFLEYGGLSVSGKTHYAATTELPTGFYRVSVENSSVSYVIAVGDTKQMVQSIQADLNATANEYSNRAQEIRDKLNTGKFTTYRTTTNANGSFNFSTGSNVKTVAIQAYKTPPGMAESPENATLEDIRTFYATTDYNGSVVLPSNVETVDAPSSNNTVRVREYSAPNYPDLQTFENKTELFNQFLKNLSYSELPSQYQQPTVDVTRKQWKTSYETLRSLVEGRPEVEKRAQELLDSDEELFIDASEATTAELRQRATVMQQAFAETPNTIETGRLETSTTTDTISARFPFNTDLEPEDVMVTVQYPNGTSEVLNTSSEYVSVESNIGNDAVVINDFPVSSDGPASVSFGVKVANEDGVATDRERVDNPAVSGTPPSIESISLSTLRPGPDESVSMSINGGDETTITNITQATVYGPSGSKLDTTVESNQEVEFTTAGQGIHTMQVTFETSDGKTATVTERITAGTNPKAMPPGVRVSESPLGVYAVTGDGIDAGEVSIENGGSSVTVLAQLEETADVPSTLHVYTSGLSLPPSSDLTVRVVQGDAQQSISRNVIVSVHLAQLPTDTATIYANGEPLPRDGGNANGEVTTTASGTTVQTLTDANGVLELSTDASPGRIDRLIYRLELDTGFNIPALTLLPGLPGWAPPAGAGLLFIGVPLAARRSSR